MSHPAEAPDRTPVERSQVLDWLRLARETRGQGSVLDALRLLAPGIAWEQCLPRHAGVSVLDAIPTPARLLSASEECALYETPDGRQQLLMADPWDEPLMARVVAGRPGFVEPVAVPMALLQGLGAAPAGMPPALTGVRGRNSLNGTPGGDAGNTTGGAVGFVDRALHAAWTLGASDVHFECDRHGVSAKHRLDGVICRFERMEGFVQAEEVVSRIKVLAQLDITERRLPQDGRFRYAFGAAQEVDLRVSIMPSVFGEDAVLRLLDKSTLRSAREEVSLDSLGFQPAAASRLRQLARLPHGMLLVTGPTGSGKTTTVYAALSEINTGLEKIITIEDPVEYELPGVLQIPVNEKKGLTFARGLRSILRHDPDRILVGEIRDPETAEIAVQSALTGHLVFTTVHANSLFDVIGRFRHFDLDMFGFVSSLNGVVVQRLMRRLCPHCRGSQAPSAEQAGWLLEHEVRVGSLPLAVGCAHCHGTGYKGRFVVSEVHRLNDPLRDRILAGAEVTELKRLAFDAAAQVQPLVRQALAHVLAADTSLEEVFRVVGQV